MSLSDRLFTVWRQAISLGWPITIQETLNTLMRTTDIIITGLFSPAAVAAVGLADLYAKILLRVGQGLGTGAIALSSQDTGRGAESSRDQAITQALLIGFLCGLPFVVLGVLFSHTLISVFGAESEVITLGSTYLLIILAASPMRIVGLVGARCLQGTGDTRTPMLINGSANILNIVCTVGFGIGIGILPDLGVVGVGLATGLSRTYEAAAIVSAIMSDRTTPSLVRSRSLIITRQLISVSAPNFAEGMSSTIVSFPFNALLLVFGTEANAAHHISHRIFHQVGGPFYRSFGTVASIIIGQSLGKGDQINAKFAGNAILALGFVTLGAIGCIMFGGAERLVSFFTQDSLTSQYAVLFTQVYGLSVVFLGVFYPVAGTLRGAGDTRTPFYARFISEFAFMLGFSYLTSIFLDYGLYGIYAGIVLTFICRASIVIVGFKRGRWVDKAARMMEKRESNIK